MSREMGRKYEFFINFKADCEKKVAKEIKCGIMFTAIAIAVGHYIDRAVGRVSIRS